jgi:hypothetical protein
MTESCESCKYFLSRPASWFASPGFGCCRFFPPHPFWGRNLIEETQWCGQYLKRTNTLSGEREG